MAFSVFLGQGTSNFAKCMALLHGVRILRSLGITKAEIEMDSLVVVKWLKSSRCEVWYLEEYWDEILELLKHQQFTIRHIFRQGNAPADFMARMGSSGCSTRWHSFNELPQPLKGLLRMDKLDFPYLRLAG
ncbi:uncharacterized protein LOC121265720 [Juglans microcarpa x Juglans regia]|uniref:uncharacterized protein LOC121265720 n=1 Tax=Juglans microcarpa x Juglans regia TaxID=2249226 RepID=UPI001B7DA93B|nr:uncharacterized protein LOC121265720 [Juglans microcarpa x Juglans regia]